MSKTGVNTGFAKCFILFMAIVILLQGCAYVGLSVTGIIMKKCSEETTNIMDEPFQFAIDLIYFANEKCPPSVTINYENHLETVDLSIDYDKSSVITHRMTIFLYTYLVVSVLWIISSLLIIFTICGRLTKLVSYLCFWPWFIFVIAGSILDAVATGFHIHDIVHTTSAEETFDYVGVLHADVVLEYISSFEMYFVTPAVVLTCISSRVVLIWLLNIFGTAFCLSISRVVSKSNSAKGEVYSRPQNNSNIATQAVTIAQVPSPQQQLQQQPQPQPQLQMQQQAFQPAEIQPKQIKPKPLPIQVVPPPQVRASQQPNEQPALNSPPHSSHYPSAIYPSAPAPEDVGTTDFKRQTSIAKRNTRDDDIVTYRPVDSHPDRLNYPIQSAVEERATSSPQLSVISPLNNRYSSTAEIHNPQQPQRVSDELRSQLPWSYTNLTGGKPPVLRKPPAPATVYPQIPEPDYTKYD